MYVSSKAFIDVQDQHDLYKLLLARAFLVQAACRRTARVHEKTSVGVSVLNDKRNGYPLMRL